MPGRLQRFLRTPKGMLLAFLLLLAPVAGLGPGLRQVWPGLLAATLAAGLLDLVLLRWMRGRWQFPSGALLTGLIVAMVLTAHEPWTVDALTAAIGIGAKYVFRTRLANVFNPAALGIVATYSWFHTGQDWWGALGELRPWAVVLLIAGGAIIVDRVNKFPLLLAFLGTFFLLATLAAFVGDAANVSELFRAPDAQATLFFAFFILTDPPTSPAQYHDQVLFGVGVAVLGFAAFEWIGAAWYLLGAVLAGNLWECWRRNRRARRGPRASWLERLDTLGRNLQDRGDLA